MGASTGIEWTDATWNPIGGCSIKSPGCTNCYAQTLAGRRLRHHPLYAGTTSPSKAGPVFNGHLTAAPDDHPVWTWPLRWRGAKRPRLGPGKPSMIFVGDMSDLFHEDRPDSVIDRVFAVMALCPQHIFQVLTKRPERMRTYLSDPRAVRRIYELVCDLITEGTANAILIAPGVDPRLAPPGRRIHLDTWPLHNVWLGVSAERQQEADQRIPLLLDTPAAIRFVSAEPLLAPINLTRWLDPTGIHCMDVCPDTRYLLAGEISYVDPGDGDVVPVCPHCGLLAQATGYDPGLDWVIAGGESGRSARPMHPAWPRSLRDQCQAAGVPFLFKQWGEWAPHRPVAGGDLGGDVRRGTVRIVHRGSESDVEVSLMTGGRNTLPGSRYVTRVGKKAAGRRLDGRECNAFPTPPRQPGEGAANE